MIRWLLGTSLVMVLLAAAGLAWVTRDMDGPIAQIEAGPVRDAVPAFIGGAHTPDPIEVAALPPHPFLAPQGQNSMHNDSHQSDAYAWSGPLGLNPQVDSAQFHPLVGNCVAAALEPGGRLVSTCVTPFGVTLVARDANTLEILARKKITHWLPIGNKFGGGVYFHLDHRGRVLLASNAPAIELWSLEGEGAALAWVKVQSIPLGGALDAVETRDHRVIDVMPDWQGNYWFITRRGLVGVSDREGASTHVVQLPGEGIDNALAVGPRGVFVASDHALYRFARDDQGQPDIQWRATYDRGSAPKPGTMGHGTGTTPTLLGDDFVAITDNADGRINVVVYRQQPEEGSDPLFCSIPVFLADLGTSENSLSAIGHSVIVENNFGYQGPFENYSAEPGIARVDIDPGAGSCVLAWENLEISSPSAVPKVSLANGLVYLYTRDSRNPQDLHAWYFTAVDARTGELVFKILTGVGKGFNNHYGSISITPDGSAYVGTIQGVVRVRDGR